MTQQIQPIFILPEGAMRTKGKDAQHNNIAAAKAIADTIRTTLGPRGMDKMLVDSLGEITVTNDGATILDEMEIAHPAAKMIVEIAKTQEAEIGDGTTTAVVLAGELLKNAEDLLDKNIHPTLIIRGYQIGSEKAVEILKKLAKKVDINDKEMLKKVCLTAMTGKGAEVAKEKLSEIVVQAVTQVAKNVDDISEIDKEDIKIEKKAGASVEDSELIYGILLDKERVHPDMPLKVENARILLIDSPIEVKSTEIDAKIQITDPSQIQAFLDQEEAILKEKVEQIKKLGANVVFCQKGIDDVAQYYLAKYGIYAVRRVKRSDLERLAKATDAKIISNLEDATSQDLGKAKIVEEIIIGNEAMTVVKGTENPRSVTILIRGGSEHVVDEIKRAVEDAVGDAIAVLKSQAILPGAGAIEVELYRQLKEFASKHSGRIQLALEAFANAMLIIPKSLAENAGLDSVDVITELNAKHNESFVYGIDVNTGKSIDAIKQGIIEPLSLKIQAIKSATEVATMILRIDDVIAAGEEKNKNNPEPNQPVMS